MHRALQFTRVLRPVGSKFLSPNAAVRQQLLSYRPFSTSDIEFKLADIGEGIAEVELMKWFVKEGDQIKSFDRICEVQSDKATVEITSRYDGSVAKLHHGEGDIVKVGESLLLISQQGGVAAGAAKAVEQPPTAAAAAPIPAPAAEVSASTEETAFKLADIGEGIAEVELMKWFVKEGDHIKSFDRICEVQSDKATVEITSRYDGVVGKLLHGEGDVVKVGGTLLNIRQSGGAAAAPAAAPAVAASPASYASTVNRNAAPLDSKIDLKVHATPAVRRIAKENSIGIRRVTGTGPKGRILKEDVLNFIQNGGNNVPTSVPAVSSISAPSSSESSASSFSSLTKEDRVVPIRGVQRLMVKSMTAANSVPHLTYADEIIFDKMKKMRSELNASLDPKDGIKVSFMPMMLKAASLALLQYPQLNATVNQECTEVTYHGSHNIGVAMDTPSGLIVPVIKNVETKSILELARELAELQALGSAGKLTAEHLSGGTFSLSNIGSIGGTYVVPVVVVPQVVIGAMGKLQTLPRYVDSNGNAASMQLIDSGEAKVAPQTIMAVSWSADHRVADGATVARFSNVWKSYIEFPHTMMGAMR